jgi:hypothetical protein
MMNSGDLRGWAEENREPSQPGFHIASHKLYPCADPLGESKFLLLINLKKMITFVIPLSLPPAPPTASQLGHVHTLNLREYTG